jgi:Ubiquitin carboxyl-terminal hydrolase
MFSSALCCHCCCHHCCRHCCCHCCCYCCHHCCRHCCCHCCCHCCRQVLFFIPSFRNAVLVHKPEPGAEFCLACQMLLLFKLLMRPPPDGAPCVAANLLRALRASREAAALGLLEGTLGAGGGTTTSLTSASGSTGAGTGTTTSAPLSPGLPGSTAQGRGSSWGAAAAAIAARSLLPKRVINLCRFLLDHLYKCVGVIVSFSSSQLPLCLLDCLAANSLSAMLLAPTLLYLTPPARVTKHSCVLDNTIITP